MTQKKQSTNLKHIWADQQDEFLRKIVPTKGRINWTKITEELNNNFTPTIRTSKQCRERYVNYSRFSQGDSQVLRWRSQEFQKLFEEFGKFGPRWNLIAQSIPHKSGNSIKNKFYGGLRKAVRKMNQMEKGQNGRIKKKLKYQSVVRIIQAPECLSSLDPKLKEQSLELRKKIILLIRQYQQEYQQQQILDLVNRINQFNLHTRSYRTKRRRNQVEEGEAQVQQAENEDDHEDMDHSQSKQLNIGLDSGKSSDRLKNESHQLTKSQGLLLEQPKPNSPKKIQSQQQNPISSQAGLNKAFNLDAPMLREVQLPQISDRSKGRDQILDMLEPEQSSPLEQSDLY